MRRFALLVAGLALLCGDARARVIGSSRDVPADRASLEVQSDPVFLLELGYGHRWAEPRSLSLEATLTVPLLTVNRLDDFELGFGAAIELWRRGRWGLRGGLFGAVAYSAATALTP